MRSTIKKKREKKYPTESQTQGKERKGVIKNETSPKIHEIKLGKKKKKRTLLRYLHEFFDLLPLLHSRFDFVFGVDEGRWKWVTERHGEKNKKDDQFPQQLLERERAEKEREQEK